MAKYEANEYRCKACGDYYHTKRARDNCERSHYDPD